MNRDIWITVQIGTFPDKPDVTHRVALSGEILTASPGAVRYSLEKAIGDIMRLLEHEGLKLIREGHPAYRKSRF